MPVGTSLMSMIIRRKQVLGKIFKGIYMCIFKITFKNIYIKYTLLSYAYEQMREYMRMGIINTMFLFCSYNEFIRPLVTYLSFFVC